MDYTAGIKVKTFWHENGSNDVVLQGGLVHLSGSAAMPRLKKGAFSAGGRGPVRKPGKGKEP